jgi:hypothetical protein
VESLKGVPDYMQILRKLKSKGLVFFYKGEKLLDHARGLENLWILRIEVVRWKQAESSTSLIYRQHDEFSDSPTELF